MKHQPRCGLAAIKHIAKNAVADGLQMHAQLVRAAGERLQFQSG